MSAGQRRRPWLLVGLCLIGVCLAPPVWADEIAAGEAPDVVDLRRDLDPAHDSNFLLPRADVLESGQFSVRGTLVAFGLTLSYAPIDDLQISATASPLLIAAVDGTPFTVSAKWAFIRDEQLVVSAFGYAIGIADEHVFGAGPAFGLAADVYPEPAGRFGLHITLAQMTPLFGLSNYGVSDISIDFVALMASVGGSLMINEYLFLTVEAPIMFGFDDGSGRLGWIAGSGGLRISGTHWALDLGVLVADEGREELVPLPLISWTGRS